MIYHRKLVSHPKESVLMSISILPFTQADLIATDSVVKTAFNIDESRQASLQRYLTLPSSGSFVARCDNKIIGFGGTLDYGPFAYIGLMSVHPSMQHKGVGKLLFAQLLAWLEGRQCPTILLDASSSGAPLYYQAGFIAEDATVVLHQTQPSPLSAQLPPGVSILTDEDFPALVAFDTPHFGSDRGELLASFRARAPERVLITRDEQGHITGYLIAQANTIGPWITRTAEDAERLLLHALALPFKKKPGMFVSAHNSAALQLLTRYGFSQQRTLSHMRKGIPIQRNRQTTLYGQASLGWG